MVFNNRPDQVITQTLSHRVASKATVLELSQASLLCQSRFGRRMIEQGNDNIVSQAIGCRVPSDFARG